MKYIEELTSGDFFEYDNNTFLLSSDFKKNGSRMAINIDTGFPIWIEPSSVVNYCQLFKLDKDNNIISAKNVSTTTTNISQIVNLAH